MSFYSNTPDTSYKNIDDTEEILTCSEPNDCASVFSKQIWRIFMENSFVALFILFSNYFFAILPVLIIFFQKIRNKKEKKPKFGPLLNIISIFFFFFPLAVNFYQLVFFKRFISLRMTRTYFFGQIVSLILYGLSQSNYLITKIAYYPMWAIMLVTFTFYLLLFLMYIPTGSEFVKN